MIFYIKHSQTGEKITENIETAIKNMEFENIF